MDFKFYHDIPRLFHNINNPNFIDLKVLLKKFPNNKHQVKIINYIFYKYGHDSKFVEKVLSNIKIYDDLYVDKDFWRFIYKQKLTQSSHSFLQIFYRRYNYSFMKKVYISSNDKVKTKTFPIYPSYIQIMLMNHHGKKLRLYQFMEPQEEDRDTFCDLIMKYYDDYENKKYVFNEKEIEFLERSIYILKSRGFNKILTVFKNGEQIRNYLIHKYIVLPKSINYSKIIYVINNRKILTELIDLLIYNESNNEYDNHILLNILRVYNREIDYKKYNNLIRIDNYEYCEILRLILKYSKRDNVIVDQVILENLLLYGQCNFRYVNYVDVYVKHFDLSCDFHKWFNIHEQDIKSRFLVAFLVKNTTVDCVEMATHFIYSIQDVFIETYRDISILLKYLVQNYIEIPDSFYEYNYYSMNIMEWEEENKRFSRHKRV